MKSTQKPYTRANQAVNECVRNPRGTERMPESLVVKGIEKETREEINDTEQGRTAWVKERRKKRGNVGERVYPAAVTKVCM